MSETPTTQLEAVNQMLRAIGESPVPSLVGDVGVDVVTAKATLTEVSRAVQLKGWLFNLEEGFPLPRSTETGEITVPANAAKVDIPAELYPEVDAVQRGRRIYDRKNHTYRFSEDLTATVVFILPFEDLPETARQYIAYRAARKFQDTSVGSADLHRFNKSDENMARLEFEHDQAVDQNLNILTGTPDFRTYLRNR